jgi:NADH-quinone oxidoreductase subunit N
MDNNLMPVLPAVQVLLTALVVIVRDLFIDEHEPKGYLAFISLIGMALAAAESVALWGAQEGAFGDSIILDNLALYFSLVFLLAAALTILSSIHYLRQAGIHEGEFYALILFATVGMMLMASANDLLVFFLGLETMSIAVYVLTGMWRASERSSEAAMKYFLMGAFATGFLLYGIALIYGATGSTNLNMIADYLIEQPSDWPVYLTGGGFLLLVGFAFKVGAVPFHFWVPDAYEGAPTPVTGFMAVAVKAAGFAAWARILLHKLSPLDTDWVFRHDDVGQSAGGHSIERQAHARLFERRPCRIFVDCDRCRRRVGRPAAAFLRLGLRVHDHRRLRRLVGYRRGRRRE